MGRQKSYDRQEVLQRAMALFWAKGYEGTHLAELVEVTGVNRFGLYGEFGGKEGLFQEALELYLSQARSAYQNTLGAEPRGLGNIRRYFRELQFEDGYHGCFMVNTLTEQQVISTEAFNAARALVLETEALYLSNLEAAQRAGKLPENKLPTVLAKLLTTLDTGLSIYGIVSPDQAAKDSVFELVEQLLQ